MNLSAVDTLRRNEDELSISRLTSAKFQITIYKSSRCRNTSHLGGGGGGGSGTALLGGSMGHDSPEFF